MRYFLSGKATARGGGALRARALAGATLIFYRSEETDAGSRFPRWSWSPVAAADVAGEVGRAAVRDDGRFEVALDEYHGGGLRVALAVERFSRAPASGKSAFGLLGDFQPVWSARRRNVPSATVSIDLNETATRELLGELALPRVAGRAGRGARGEPGSLSRLSLRSDAGSSARVGFAPGWPSETSKDKPPASGAAVGFAPGWPLPREVPPAPLRTPGRERKLA
ncbi:MAG: hypothetical protein GY856_53305 [bacterium]|nr:hypothetical protein [bacterium]